MGWHGGSRGKVRRMRARPVVPVGKPREVGKEQQAGARRNHTGGLTGFQHMKNFFSSVVMRRGRHDQVLWCETFK